MADLNEIQASQSVKIAGAALTIYVISGGTVDCRITEVS